MTDEELAQLQAQVESVSDVESGASERVGEHILLVALIQKFGYAVHNFGAAFRLALQLLGWDRGKTDDDYADDADRNG